MKNRIRKVLLGVPWLWRRKELSREDCPIEYTHIIYPYSQYFNIDKGIDFVIKEARCSTNDLIKSQIKKNFTHYVNQIDDNYLSVSTMTVNPNTEISCFFYKDKEENMFQDIVLRNGLEIMRFKRKI